LSQVTRFGALLACVLAAGCQIVLGFEEHVLLVGGAGGGLEGGGGGGPIGGAAIGFGDPEEVHDGLGPLDAVAIAGADIYVLEQAAGGHRLQRSRGGALAILASDLLAARGLVTAGSEVITTHGQLDDLDVECHVSAFADQERRDVMSELCDDGENSFFAVAAEGELVAASFLETQGNDHSDIRRAPLSGGGAGTLIGLGEDEDEAVPSLAIGNGVFFWVDSQLDDVMSSAGGEVTSIVDPPGDSVNTLAEGLTTLNEVVVADGMVYVARDGQIAAIEVSGQADELSEADSPRGLAADSAIVVWAEDGEVRAHIIESGETVTLDEPDDEPTDVALSPSFVVYVTAAGRIVLIPRI
jgi:hypothetical protein